jgi:hypothetical protein
MKEILHILDAHDIFFRILTIEIYIYIYIFLRVVLGIEEASRDKQMART